MEPLKQQLWRLGIRFMSKSGLYPRRIPTPDGNVVFVVDPAVIFSNMYDQYVRREYERVPSFVPRPGWCVIDVGAHIGLFAMRAARLVGGHGRVVAFEPNPLAFYWLRLSLARNGLSNVLALPVALGSRGEPPSSMCLWRTLGQRLCTRAMSKERQVGGGRFRLKCLSTDLTRWQRFLGLGKWI